MKDKELPSQPDAGTVNLQFKVWAPGFNRVNHRLFLLGSLKQMGAWNINEAVEAFPTSDLHIWKAEVKNVPPKANFEWVWLKTRSNRSQIQWERAVKRNRTIDNYSGIIHSVFGEGQEVFQQTATCVELTTFIKVAEGHMLVLTGDSISTGLWDLTRAIKAKEYPRQSGYWKAQVSFDASTSLNFKWAVIREKDRKLQVMEKNSHCLYGRPSMVRAVAPWNLPRVFVVDTNIGIDPLDNMAGRTDLIIGDRKMRLDEIRNWLNKANKGKTPSLVPLSQVPTPKHPPTSSTPSSTDIELAKAAILQMSNKAIPLPTQQSANRQPTVKAVTNIEEHSKQRHDRLTRIQKLVRQFNDEYTGSGAVTYIKGKGQSDEAKESDESCDWSQHFPWSYQDATAYEARCLGLKSDPKPRDDISVQAFRIVEIRPQNVMTDVSFVTKDTEELPECSKKDEVEHLDDEDSGLDSMSHSANVSQEVESISSLTEEHRLGYDLVPQGFSEIVHDSEKGLEVNQVQEQSPSAASNATCVASDMKLSVHLKSYEMDAEKLIPYSPVDAKEESKATTANSIMETVGVVDSCDMEKESAYLDWLSRRVEREGKYYQKIKQAKSAFDSMFDNSAIGWEGEMRRDKDMYEDVSQNSTSFNPVYIADEAPFIDTETNGSFEHSDHRRQMARVLEEQWGSTGLSPSRAALQNPPEVIGRPSYLTRLNKGNGDLAREGIFAKTADYANVELLIAVQAPPPAVDHRSMARMLELRWGMMAVSPQC